MHRNVTQWIGRWLLLMVWCAGWSSAVLAQDLPGNIPDDPRAVPDRQKETLKERHRDLISRLYAGTQVSAAPTFQRDLVAYGAYSEVGVDLAPHHALSLAFGVREYVVRSDAPDETHGHPMRRLGEEATRKKTVSLFTVNYNQRLAAWGSDARFARRTFVGLGFGGALGDGHLITVDLTPSYEIPVHAKWSLPVGIKIGHALMGKDRARVRGTYVGFSVSVKRRFGHRDVMKVLK